MDYAKPRDVEEFASTLKNQYLWCRTYGHSFKPRTVRKGVATEGRPTAYFEQVLVCACRVKRVILMSRTGHVVSSKHDYDDAPGYLTKGLGRIVGEARDVLRLEYVERQMERY